MRVGIQNNVVALFWYDGHGTPCPYITDVICRDTIYRVRFRQKSCYHAIMPCYQRTALVQVSQDPGQRRQRMLTRGRQVRLGLSAAQPCLRMASVMLIQPGYMTQMFESRACGYPM